MSTLLLFAPLLGSALAFSCNVSWDGLVPRSATGATFDNGTILPYNNEYDLGQNQTWADVLRFPNVPQSRFDRGHDTKAVEITLSDGSIFKPGASDAQVGFRRTELLAQPAAGLSALTTGKQTVHFSILKDLARPLNGSHEYYVFWNERVDYAHNPVAVSYGELFGSDDPAAKNTLHIRGNDGTVPQPTFYETPFLAGLWHNIALTLDYDHNTTEVWFSRGQDRLECKGLFENDLSDAGQFHFGLLKKPTGQNLTDITTQGFQESHIHEGLIYGGNFVEDSEDGCVSR